MNNITLIGRITKDLELKQAGNANKCDFTIAVDRKFAKEGQQKTDFINCVCWGKVAENLVNHQGKGKLIAVNGELNIDQYQNAEGENRTFTKVNANNIEYLERKNDNTSNGIEPVGLDSQGFQVVDDDDIPF